MRPRVRPLSFLLAFSRVGPSGHSTLIPLLTLAPFGLPRAVLSIMISCLSEAPCHKPAPNPWRSTCFRTTLNPFSLLPDLEHSFCQADVVWILSSVSPLVSFTPLPLFRLPPVRPAVLLLGLPKLGDSVWRSIFSSLPRPDPFPISGSLDLSWMRGVPSHQLFFPFFAPILMESFFILTYISGTSIPSPVLPFKLLVFASALIRTLSSDFRIESILP